MRRGVWFSVGVAAGAYGVLRIRRLAEAFTPDGLRDRVSGISAGVRVFNEEVRTGMTEKEDEIRTRMGLMLEQGRPALESSDHRSERELT